MRVSSHEGRYAPQRFKPVLDQASPLRGRCAPQTNCPPTNNISAIGISSISNVRYLQAFAFILRKDIRGIILESMYLCNLYYYNIYTAHHSLYYILRLATQKKNILRLAYG